MPQYRYKAITKGGQIVRNRIDDTNQQSVVNRLKSNGLTPISIEKIEVRLPSFLTSRRQKKNKVTTTAASHNAIKKLQEKEAKKKKSVGDEFKLDLSFLQQVKPDDVIAFTQSLYLLKKANFTNVRALTTLLENTTNPAMRDIVEDILNGVEAGEFIYSTMEYYSKVFPDIYISMIKVGELGGTLVKSLEQALKYLEDSTKIKRTVRKAISGPLFQSGFLLAMSVVCVIMGLPVMQRLYGEFGVEDQIPAATVAFSNFILALGKYWYLTIGVVAGLIGLFIFWKSTPEGHFQWDRFKLRMPIFGPLILRLNLQKFFKALQLNLANNSKLQDAIELSKSVIQNYMLLSIIETAQSNLQVGDSWIAPFEDYPDFPPMVLEMLKIGMETDMVEMIDRIVEFIEEDIQITMNRIIKTLPEVANVVMGLVLIAFVIVVLKPIMDVYLGTFLTQKYL